MYDNFSQKREQVVSGYTYFGGKIVTMIIVDTEKAKILTRCSLLFIILFLRSEITDINHPVFERHTCEVSGDSTADG